MIYHLYAYVIYCEIICIYFYVQKYAAVDIRQVKTNTYGKKSYIPQVKTNTYGKKSFRFSAATVRNGLPNHFRKGRSGVARNVASMQIASIALSVFCYSIALCKCA